MKISRKLLIVFLLISLVPLLVADLLSYFFLRANIKNNTNSHLEAVAAVQYSRLKEVIDRDLERIALITSRTQLRLSLASYIKTHDPKFQLEINYSLKDTVSSVRAFKNITVLDMNGKVIGSTDSSQTGKDESGEKFFKKSQGGEEAITLFQGENKTLMQYLSGPLMMNDSQIGVVNIESEASGITAIANDYTGLGSTGETLIAMKDINGDALFIHPLRFDKNAAFSRTVDKKDKGVPINIALSKKSTLVSNADDYLENPVIAVTRYIENPELGLVVKEDSAEVFSSVGTLGNIIGLVFLLTALLVIAVAVYFSRSITKPIVDLTEVAREIDAGDLSRKADEKAAGEIGLLGRTLNQMTEHLAEAQHNLEKKVKKRTLALKAMTESLEDEIAERKMYEKALKESEEQYRDLFENAGELIQSVDPEGNFIYVNPAWRKTLEYSEEETKSLNLFDIIHPDCMDNCRDKFKRVLSGEDVGRIEVEFVSKSGRRIIVEGDTSCRFEDGKPVNTRGIFRDVTERKKAEEQINRFAALVKSSQDAIIAKDLDGTITSWNLGAKKIYGYSPDEAIGKNISMLEPADQSGETLKLLEKIRSGETVESYDTRRVSKDGKEVYVLVTLSSIKDDSGKIIGASAVARDVTERKRALEAMEESEEKFRTITSTVNEAIILTDHSGTITYWNKAAENIFGYSEAEALGMNIFSSFAPPLDKEKLWGIFESFIRTGKGFGVGETQEVESVGKGGRIIPVELSMTSTNVGGEWRAIGVVRDITERKKASEALLESEKKFRTIASTANDAIILIGNDGRIAFWNQAAEKIFGYSESEAMGKELHPFLAPPGFMEAYFQAFPHFKETGEGNAVGKTLELEGKRQNGEVFPMELSLSAIKMGGDWQAIGIVRDITDRKEAEEELQKINTELEGFAHTVSHDLKSPLTAILVAVDTVKELVNQPKSAETLEMIDEVVEILDHNVKNASRLIEDLLSQAEAGQQPASLYDLEVRDVVDRVVGERKSEIENIGIQLDVDRDLGRIRANLSQVYQIFTNLIGNAIKHSKSTHPVIQVSYLGDNEDGAHRYMVRDNGQGIKEEDLDKIFLPFYMGEGGGTGIGLSTVQKIVHLYDGDIKAYNDNGACFEFNLKDYPNQETGETI